MRHLFITARCIGNTLLATSILYLLTTPGATIASLAPALINIAITIGPILINLSAVLLGAFITITPLLALYLTTKQIKTFNNFGAFAKNNNMTFTISTTITSSCLALGVIEIQHILPNTFANIIGPETFNSSSLKNIYLSGFAVNMLIANLNYSLTKNNPQSQP
jgi:hypothetical protein